MRPSMEMTTSTLTPRQRAVYNAIGEYVRAHGYPPTFREIGATVGLKSSRSVSDIVHVLIDRGLVTSEPGTARTLRIVQ